MIEKCLCGSQSMKNLVAAFHNYHRHPSLSRGKTCQRALGDQHGEKCRSLQGLERAVDQISENIALALVVIIFVASFNFLAFIRM